MINPSELVHRVKKLVLNRDVNGLKDLPQHTKSDIKELVRAKQDEIKGIVKGKINELKQQGETKKAEVLAKIDKHEENSEEMQLRAKNQVDGIKEKVLAMIETYKTMVLDIVGTHQTVIIRKINEIKAKLGIAA